ncbi:MAG: hypothetical protein FWD57_03170 [Polyangiaceae bacterium]|nr:hypothetical protein [Polyangiaceae bacterium]
MTTPRNLLVGILLSAGVVGSVLVAGSCHPCGSTNCVSTGASGDTFYTRVTTPQPSSSQPTDGSSNAGERKRVFPTAALVKPGKPCQATTAAASGGSASGRSILTRFAISTGSGSTCAITPAGRVKCWGSNSAGQLGDGSTLSRHIASPVIGLNAGMVAVSSGSLHACSVNSSGALFCWGTNDEGQLGDNSLEFKLSPSPVPGLASDIVAVSAGGKHTCAIVSDGAVVCWGDRDMGQLGHTHRNNMIPTQVMGLDACATAISAGWDHTCAITAGGKLWCWGSRALGKTGIADDAARGARVLSAMPVPSLQSGVMDVSAGARHTCAVTSGGAVRCWGSNTGGVLGNGNEQSSAVPTQVVGLNSGFVGVSVGEKDSCAVASSGKVMCWGSKYQSGQHDRSSSLFGPPQEIKGLGPGAVAVSVGNFHSCALIRNGKVMCWGDNDHGRLGNSTTRHSDEAVQVLNFP